MEIQQYFLIGTAALYLIGLLIFTVYSCVIWVKKGVVERIAGYRVKMIKLTLNENGEVLEVI
jgi:hypothetical protein